MFLEPGTAILLTLSDIYCFIYINTLHGFFGFCQHFNPGLRPEPYGEDDGQFFFFFLYFCNKVSFNPGWSRMYYIAKVNFELIVLLFLTPKCWNISLGHQSLSYDFTMYHVLDLTCKNNLRLNMISSFGEDFYLAFTRCLEVFGYHVN